MRIAQLANFVGPTSGGLKTAVAALAEGYVDAGVERMLVIPGETDRTYDTPLGPVVEVRAPKVSSHGYRMIVEPWRALDALQAWGPTSLELSDKFTLVPITWWARRQGIGTMLINHERLDDQVMLRKGYSLRSQVSIGLLNRIVVRSFDTIVVTSRYAQRELQKHADAAETPMVRVPLGVDLQRFQPLPHEHSDELRLILVGRLSREKSPELAVGTAAELHRRGVRFRLDVYGEGPMLEELRGIAGAAPVHFHGHLSDRAELARRIARADIALSVCPGETFGLAVLEALASGTPVVTADRGGARELIDRFCGAWGAPTPESLADAVLTLAGRPVALRRDSARARAEMYPWSRTIDTMLALHQELYPAPELAYA